MITSYDYGSPLSESGHTGQPGLGGPNGFEVRASGLLSIVSCNGVLGYLAAQDQHVHTAWQSRRSALARDSF